MPSPEVSPSPLSLHMCQHIPGSVPLWLMVTGQPGASSCACRTGIVPPSRSAACEAAAGPASPPCKVRLPLRPPGPATLGTTQVSPCCGSSLERTKSGPGWEHPMAPIAQDRRTHPALPTPSISSRHSLALAGKGCNRSWVPEPLSSHPVGEQRAAAAPSTHCPSFVPAPGPLHCQPIAPALL